MKEKARRYSEGKLRYDLMPKKALEEIARVYTNGGKKMDIKDENGNVIEKGDDNWRKGMPWTSVIAPVKRHIEAWIEGEDIDPDPKMNTYHLANAAWGLMTILEYYHLHPEYDDRKNTFFDKKIALDIDGVICDWNKGISELNGTDYERNHWYYSYSVKRELGNLSSNKEFWMNLEPIFNGPDIPFDPVCYVTSRPIKKEWCEEWIEKNNFPCVPIYVTNGDKSEILKPMVDRGEVDFFVDDKYQNFVELNKNGVFTYLMDQPWNWKYEVGHKRIYSLKDLV